MLTGLENLVEEIFNGWPTFENEVEARMPVKCQTSSQKVLR